MRPLLQPPPLPLPPPPPRLLPLLRWKQHPWWCRHYCAFSFRLTDVDGNNTVHAPWILTQLIGPRCVDSYHCYTPKLQLLVRQGPVPI